MKEVGKNSVLVLIDVQKAWADPAMGERNNPKAETRIADLLEKFRSGGKPIIHIRHSSLNPNSLFREGKTSFDFNEAVRPRKEELVITKHVNSAFIGTNLEGILRGFGSPEVYYVGIATDYCVSATARMSGNLGFKSYVVEDACATFTRKDKDGEEIPAEEVHRINLASIDGEFAEVIESYDLVL